MLDVSRISCGGLTVVKNLVELHGAADRADRVQPAQIVRARSTPGSRHLAKPVAIDTLIQAVADL